MTEPTKYRKKPVVITASQWFQHGDHPAVVRVPYDHSLDRHAIRPGEWGWVETLEGGHLVRPGDWIITGIQGEHYPCKPDIFAASYEPAHVGRVDAQASSPENAIVNRTESITDALVYDPLVGAGIASLMTYRPTPDQPTEDDIMPSAQDAWHSIASAPKDGTHIILFDGEVVSVGGWVSAADQGAEPGEEYLISAGWWSIDLRDNKPTHWMPLPLPPSPLAGQERA